MISLALTSQGQPKGKAEIPVVTRECHRNSRINFRACDGSVKIFYLFLTWKCNKFLYSVLILKIDTLLDYIIISNNLLQGFGERFLCR